MIILGLDGLEYTFVKEWNLKNLQQAQYGQIIVPIDKIMKIPYSPQVWYSFMTGKWDTSLDFNRGKISYLIKPLRFLRRHLPIKLGLGMMLDKHKTPITFPKIKGTTFIEDYGIIPFNAPFYNHVNDSFVITHKLLKGEVSMDDVENYLWNLYQKRKSELLKLFAGVFERGIFIYLRFPDCVQDALLERPWLIKMYYYELDSLVSALKEKAEQKFLIISDHGFNLEKRKHSLLGFYSSNFEIHPPPKKITDFYKLFAELKTAETIKSSKAQDKETMNTIAHLRSLGYL